MPHPFLIVSDLHLSHEGVAETTQPFVTLVSSHPGHDIILSGDALSLSSDPPERDPIESVGTLLRDQPAVASALRSHLASGRRLTLVAGNHDAALTHRSMRSLLLTTLGLSEEAPLEIEPWFTRRGEVHIEHGHVWDPDNAPVHPLSPWSVSTEPLGIALTRRFIARHRIWEFAHAHETTFAAGMSRAFHLFGARTPGLIARYFALSGQLCRETLLERGVSEERSLGDAAIAREAERLGVDEGALKDLVARLPSPTHLSFSRMVLRLYYDRVLSVLGLGVGALWAVSTGSLLGAGLALGSAGYLGVNVKRSGERYGALPVHRLRDGAEIVRHLTGARQVVFGHTHVPAQEPGYQNAGSFGYPTPGPGRPYLVGSEDGTLEARRWAVA